MNLTRIDKIFDSVKSEFYSLAGEIGQYIALSVLKYVAGDTVALVYSQQWEAGRPFARAFATASEYESDLKRWIEP